MLSDDDKFRTIILRVGTPLYVATAALAAAWFGIGYGLLWLAGLAIPFGIAPMLNRYYVRNRWL